MSDQRITIGLMAKVLSLPKIDDDELFDFLYEKNLGLSDDNKVIYFKTFDGAIYDFEMQVGVPDSTTFIEKCWELGIGIDDTNIKPFFANWYDGCDSPMSTMTLDDF